MCALPVEKICGTLCKQADARAALKDTYEDCSIPLGSGSLAAMATFEDRYRPEMEVWLLVCVCVCVFSILT